MAAISSNKKKQCTSIPYVIGGISYINPIDTFVVPDNITYVIASIDEDAIGDDDESKSDTPILDCYSRYYSALLQTDKSILGNPTIDTIQSLAYAPEVTVTIYESNSLCPAIRNSNVSYENGSCIPEINGVSYLTNIPNKIRIHRLTSDECTTSMFIINLYQYSVNSVTMDTCIRGLLKYDKDTLLSSLLRHELVSSLCNTTISRINTHNKKNNICTVVYVFVINRKTPKVYWIGGHGSEDPFDEFTVPKGCTIVVKAISGDISNDYTITPMYEQLRELNPSITMNQKINKKTIHDMVGSVAIYTEGQQCPSFYYQLLSYFPEKNRCKSNFSGIMNMDTSPTYAFFETPGIERRMLFGEYKNSDYPRCNEVELYYKDNVYKNTTTNYDKNAPITYMNHKIGDPMDVYTSFMNNKLINVSQEELCRTHPGVYYNFICRALDDNVTKSLWTIGRHKLRGTPNVSMIPSAVTTPIKKSLYRRINEAWTKRGPLERNVYNVQKIEKELKNENNSEMEAFTTIASKLRHDLLENIDLLSHVDNKTSFPNHMNMVDRDKRKHSYDQLIQHFELLATYLDRFDQYVITHPSRIDIIKRQIIEDKKHIDAIIKECDVLYSEYINGAVIPGNVSNAKNVLDTRITSELSFYFTVLYNRFLTRIYPVRKQLDGNYTQPLKNTTNEYESYINASGQKKYKRKNGMNKKRDATYRLRNNSINVLRKSIKIRQNIIHNLEKKRNNFTRYHGNQAVITQKIQTRKAEIKNIQRAILENALQN